MRYTRLQLGFAVIAAMGITMASSAQCTTFDFDGYANGTEITTQFPGVTFSAEPGSCEPYWSIYPHIVTPDEGTSSGSKALGIQVGCPDFSPDYLQMVFDEPQRYVTFTLGEQVSPGVTFYVRAYNPANAVIYAQTFVPGQGVYHLVKVGTEDWPAQIKTIQIESPVHLFETIDDLSFNHDPTPPDARIDSPTHADCLCDGTVTVSGIACDYDGAYGRDRLEYKPWNAAPGDPWIFIKEYVGSPVCDPGTLYTWDLTDVPHGWHILRMTVENACGDTTSTSLSVYVDKAFGTIEITSPASNEEVCGTITIKEP